MSRAHAPPQDLEALPASSELVYLVLLHADGRLTQAEIISRTARNRRTVRYALDKLLAEDLVTARSRAGDARQTVYQLAE